MFAGQILILVAIQILSGTVDGACQAERVGCSDDIKCCPGLICKKDGESVWGFCKEPEPAPGSMPMPPLPKNPMITRDQFNKAATSCGFPEPKDYQYANFIARAVPSGRIASKRELAMFLANIYHESDGLQTKREYGPPPADWYVHPALDVAGQTYYGRGYIQLTWSYNYAAASKALYGDDRLLKNADMVAKNETVAWDVSFWYWSANVHDKPGISEGKFGVSIKAINGGIECGPNAVNKEGPKRRFAFYEKVYKAFGVSGKPDERGCYN